MIIIQISGGLGNQLQQFSMYEKFRSIGKQAKLDISEYKKVHRNGTFRDLELNYFKDMKYDIATPKEIEELIGKSSLLSKLVRKISGKKSLKYTEHLMYDPSIFELNDAYIEGYFACEKYYMDIIGVLRNKLTFPIDTHSKNYELASKMQNEESVSIHIRRGDYLNPENYDLFANICTDEYYMCAIKYLSEKYPGLHFYVFSDDVLYAKEHYSGDQFTIVDWNNAKDSFYDMYLMSHCKYNICANSTFSFWGARLNSYEKKEMIRPLKQRNNATYIPKTLHQLWKNWILVDEKGNIV